MDGQTESALRGYLDTVPEIELAVLVGSRASGEAGPNSDWDFAIQWTRKLKAIDLLAQSERLRRALARMLKVNESSIDLIDLPRARLAMRALVADQGRVLKGDDSPAWTHFLSRTWRELEDYQWERDHAA